MVAVASGADVLANGLLTSLTADKDFTFPTINLDASMFDQPGTTGALYENVDKIKLSDLTTGEVGGTGAFDQLMVSLVKHLKVEYEANRITGAEYTKAYIGVITGALQIAQQFVLAKDQAHWSALLVQAQARAAEIAAIQARVELETARVMLVRTQYEAATAEVNYGLTKMKIATEDATYASQVAQNIALEAQTVGVTYTNTSILPKQAAGLDFANIAADYNNTNLLPKQLESMTLTNAGLAFTNSDLLPKQAIGLDYSNTGVNLTNTQILPKQAAGIEYTNTVMLPKEAALLQEQTEFQRSQTLDTRTDALPVTGSVGKQKDLHTQQITLIEEQTEAQRAQTLDLRSDGAAVTGSIGKQKDLYTQQITSYQRDAETKMAKLFTDSWTVQKTMDEGLLAPNQFTNIKINEVLTQLRTNLAFSA